MKVYQWYLITRYWIRKFFGLLPEYHYNVLVWGGFFNKEYRKIHGYQDGNYRFKSIEERTKFINTLESIEFNLGAKYLMTSLSEGFNCFKSVHIHRICKYKDKTLHTKRNMGVNYPFDSAQYFLENKWYPGFNDYPFGEDFDYEDPDFIVIDEWVTGSFGGED